MPITNRIEMPEVFPDPGVHLRVMRHPSHGALPVQHSHAFNELVVILGGEGSHAVGDEVYPLAAGDVFVILGDTTHGYPETNRLYLVNIIYDPAPLGIPVADLGTLPGYHALFTVEPRVRARGKFRNRLRLTVEQLAHASDLVARMEEELRDRRRGYGFMATTYLMQLMAHLARCSSALERDGTRPVAQISELLSYMERHYTEPLTVADLTGVAHMSRTTLMRAFTRIMGRSPIDHLIRLRISKARTLLRRSALSITAIGFQVGFNDSNYFARQFRKVTGLSPREYRAQRQSRRA
jgi:AraC-like DNA-binding protein